MFGARSGTMVPDKVPRKVMGGGFRSHSPPRNSLSATGVGISHGSRNEDLSTPRSAGGKGGKPAANAASSKSKLILAQEQEAAEIEREYIKNLQQQVYYLELELKYTKDKPRKDQQAPPSDQRPQAPTPSQQEQEGDAESSRDDATSVPPINTEASGAAAGSGGEEWGAPPTREWGAPPTPAAMSSHRGPIPQTPYAAVAAVREAAERACEELQRTRQQQMDEAASRAYEVTTNHLHDHIAHLETAAHRMAEAVELYVVQYEDLQAQFRAEQAETGASVCRPASGFV